MLMPFYQQTRPERKMSFFRFEWTFKKTVFSVDSLLDHCDKCIQKRDAIINSDPVEKLLSSWQINYLDIEQKRKMDDKKRERKQYCWNVGSWVVRKLHKQKNVSEPICPRKYFFLRSSQVNQAWTSTWLLLVRLNFSEWFISNHLNFKILNVVRDNMKNYASKNKLLKHPPKMLMFSFKLENGSVTIPLFTSLTFIYFFLLAVYKKRNKKAFRRF